MYKLNTFLLTVNIHYPSFGIRYDDYKNCFLENILTHTRKTHSYIFFYLALSPLTSAYYNIARAHIRHFFEHFCKDYSKT